MILNKLVFAFFLIIPAIGHAQLTFTEVELQSFVDIYMVAKMDKTKGQEILSIKLAKYDISNERYKFIFKSNMIGQNPALTDNEVKFFDDIQKEDIIEKGIKNKKIKNLCTAEGLDPKIYNKIKHKYKTDIQFQRTLKPYFDHYLKSIK